MSAVHDEPAWLRAAASIDDEPAESPPLRLVDAEGLEVPGADVELLGDLFPSTIESRTPPPDRRPAPAAPAAPGIDAADLLALELAPLRWIVPDVLPEGTTIVSAPPKVGKSCLVYQIVVEVALGGELFGRRVTPGSALYLALEDGQRRGQDRLRAALAGRTMPRGRLEVRWSGRKLGDGLEDDLRIWLDEHADAAVVAIDTLGKVRKATTGKRGAYEVDVEDLGRLQELFRDRDVALIVVHHARKAAGDDFISAVSGTYGITGSADTIVSIQRPRLEAFGSLLVSGRDVPDAKIPVRFDGLTWGSAPDSLPEASFERLEIYRIVEARGPIFPAAIAAEIGLERTSVQHMVGRLVEQGAVARTAKGYVTAEGARVHISPHHSGHYGSDSSDRGHVRAREDPPRPLSVEPETTPTTVRCSDYREHASDHVRRGAGFVCLACEPEAGL